MGKFSNAVDSLGSKTLASIARAGPDTKVSHYSLLECMLLLPEASSHNEAILFIMIFISFRVVCCSPLGWRISSTQMETAPSICFETPTVNSPFESVAKFE